MPQPDIFHVLSVGYHQLNRWPKVFHGMLHLSQTIAKAIGCFLQTDAKARLWKIPLPYYIGHREIELVPKSIN